MWLNRYKKIKLKNNEVTNDRTAFEEKQYGDIWTNDEYLQFMFERIVIIRELLSSNGTCVIHLDSSKVHLLRCIFDEVFGKNNFKNEIIWFYENKLGTGGNTIDSRHDTLLAYCKGGTQTYNAILLPVKTIKQQPVTQKIDGKRVWLKDDQGKNLYQESNSVRPLGDVWMIPIINPVANERTGYPTQKPEALLENIIHTWTNLYDLVFDCFMGSGTTQSVAMKLGRRFLGADINLGAIETTTKRLIKIAKENKDTLIGDKTLYTSFEVYNVNNYDIFRNPLEARKILLETLEVEPFESSSVYDGEKDGRMVKIIPENVNRIASKADIDGFISNLPYKIFERKKEENPGEPVLKLTVVCMGHEADLAAAIKQALHNYKVDVEVMDVLTDRKDLQFKREAEGEIAIEKGKLVVKSFYPLNLMQKLSLQKENVDDWRQLVESIKVDFFYDGAVLSPEVIDAPEKNELVKGIYEIPKDAGKIKVKITDLLSESLELETEVK